MIMINIRPDLADQWYYHVQEVVKILNRTLPRFITFRGDEEAATRYREWIESEKKLQVDL